VNSLVLTGTRTPVPLGTRFSCYRGPESELTLCRIKSSSSHNSTNLESFGFFLTDGPPGSACRQEDCGNPSATPIPRCFTAAGCNAAQHCAGQRASVGHVLQVSGYRESSGE
jgi:hypothetical protein